MMDLKVCRICLRTDAKTYKYDNYQLKLFYEEILAIKVSVYYLTLINSNKNI